MKNSTEQAELSRWKLKCWERLPDLLQEILPSSPRKAIKGAELHRALKTKLDNCSRRAFSTHILQLANDPQSVVARVEGGYGFYLRSELHTPSKRVPRVHEQLRELLPKVLPSSPEKAEMGSVLSRKLQKQLKGHFSLETIQGVISKLAHDPRSVVAQPPGKYGYYLRLEPFVTSSKRTAEKSDNKSPNSATQDLEVASSQRDEQHEEKFRSLFMRRAELDGKYAFKIEHTEAIKRTRGQDVWKFPDVVVLEWDKSVREESPGKNGIFSLRSDILEVKRALGEQPFKLTSVELKTKVAFSGLRRDFFQCVSNSSWAHSALFAIAAEIQDQVLEAELQRLGTSFGVTIETCKLGDDFLEGLPHAQKLLTMKTDQIEKFADEIERRTISTGAQKDGLDWSHIGDLKEQHYSFNKLFAWIARCLADRKAYSYAQCEAILD